MAPDRGISATAGAREQDSTIQEMNDQRESHDVLHEEMPTLRAKRANEPQNFTIRGLLVGLVIGIVICFSNMYFGLQTGWVSSMAMPSALIGFAFFKSVARYINLPFSPVENVFIQSVAGSVGTMPLGCGFVGVVPALEFMLKPSENGPLRIGLGKLIIWAVGICFFGVVFAVPLRREVIIREKLKFPSGTATALMIGVLHGEKGDATLLRENNQDDATESEDGEHENLIRSTSSDSERRRNEYDNDDALAEGLALSRSITFSSEQDWRAKIRLLAYSFVTSAIYTLTSYFIPQLRNVPILGLGLARNWLWTLNPSPAYVGQGIIMGPATTLHMFLGAVVGWGILSPLAKHKGWAPGPVEDWTTGSKGWIVWVSLAIMLADSLVSLGWLVIRPIIFFLRARLPSTAEHLKGLSWRDLLTLNFRSMHKYSAIPSSSEQHGSMPKSRQLVDDSETDAPPSQLISNRIVVVGLIASLGLSIAAVHITFPSLIPVPLTIISLLLALLLSIMGVRALGETDLNPVSGISKLTQLVISLYPLPSSSDGKSNAIIANLVAGALSESGALQAGDLLQDLKTGHLLGASPAAQFWGQIIGSAVGAVVSAVVYKLYTHVYDIPGGLFQVPTGWVWVFTARLVTGQGLPPMVGRWAIGAGVIFAFGTALRVFGNARRAAERGGRWVHFVPGGIAVAVGMYNVPSFTLARTFGGLINWYWRSYKGRDETPIIVLASGLILGEGLFSIVNLLLASLNVPHL